MLSGQWRGFDVRGAAVFSDDTLARLSLTAIVPDEEALVAFRDLVAVLKTLYGAPSHTYDFLVDSTVPRAGTDEMIRSGNRQIATFWPGGILGIRVTEDLNVEIEYRGSRWPREVARRRGSR
jgi:hypothetical protein